MNCGEQLLLLLTLSPFIYLAFRNMYLSDKMRAQAWSNAIKGVVEDES